MMNLPGFVREPLERLTAPAEVASSANFKVLCMLRKALVQEQSVSGLPPLTNPQLEGAAAALSPAIPGKLTDEDLELIAQSLAKAFFVTRGLLRENGFEDTCAAAVAYLQKHRLNF